MTAVICNGARRAGSNALRHVVAALGFEDVGGGIVDSVLRPGPPSPGRTYRPAGDIESYLRPGQMIGAHSPNLITAHCQVRILREPKNMAVSWYRWKHASPTVLGFRQWLDEERMFYNSTVPYFHHWLDAPHLVWFEDLFNPPTVIKIGKWVGVEVDTKRWDEVCHKAWAQPGTWTGELSDWREWFDGKALANFGARWSQAEVKL